MLVIGYCNLFIDISGSLPSSCLISSNSTTPVMPRKNEGTPIIQKVLVTQTVTPQVMRASPGSINMVSCMFLLLMNISILEIFVILISYVVDGGDVDKFMLRLFKL